MELELKILREKVIEDSAKSGIGSLYDDEKTSHQHIDLLKTKYSQMRRDFDRKLQDLAKQALKVKGQEFVLDAQIKVIKEQTNKLKGAEEDFSGDARVQNATLLQTNRESSRRQIGLEDECRDLSDSVNIAGRTHFENKMSQDYEVAFDDVATSRHDKEVLLVTTLKEKKQKEVDDLKAAIAQIEKDFLAMKDYQNAMAETAKLRDKIEKDKVRVQFLDIEVQALTDYCDFLSNKKDDLLEDKKIADDKNLEYST